MFGKQLQLDPKIGLGYRGWYPEQYPLVSINHAGYYTWSLDLKAKLFGFLRLHRGYYESNGLKGPRTRGAVVARDVMRPWHDPVPRERFPVDQDIPDSYADGKEIPRR